MPGLAVQGPQPGSPLHCAAVKHLGVRVEVMYYCIGGWGLNFLAAGTNQFRVFPRMTSEKCINSMAPK